MSKRVVRASVTLGEPPVLTAAMRAEIEHLKAMGDETIDTSDIPSLTDEFWQKAIRNPLYKPTKTSTTLRIDSDVLLWLRAQGRGYQSRINSILRREMLATAKRGPEKRSGS